MAFILLITLAGFEVIPIKKKTTRVGTSLKEGSSYKTRHPAL